MLRTGAINLVLKVGLMLSSIVFAITSFVQGATIIQYYPDFIINIIGESATLILGSLVAICLAIWLLSRKQRFAAVTTYLVLLTVGILFNLTSLSFLGMVWPMWCIAFALSLRYYPRVRVLAKDSHGRYVMKIIPAATAAIIASDKDLDSGEHKKSTITDTIEPNDLNTVLSTPAFEEKNEKTDTANKHATSEVADYEISHDVDATLEEIFTHAGLADTTSVADESSDDVTGIAYSPSYQQSSDLRSTKTMSEVVYHPSTLEPSTLEPSISAEDIEDTKVSSPALSNSNLDLESTPARKTIKRPRISRRESTSRTTASSVTHTKRHHVEQSIAELMDEPLAPLGEVIAIDENPRIAKKRAKAKSGSKPRAKKLKADTKVEGQGFDGEDFEDLQ